MNQKSPDFTCYCFNPSCLKPQNLTGTLLCSYCGSSLQLAEQYQAIQLYGELSRTFLCLDREQTPSTLCIVQQEETKLNLPSLEQLGKHSQLPTIFKQVKRNGLFYLVQEYIVGENLATLLRQKIKFTTSEIWQVLTSLLPVIQWIHSLGLIHCNIKPENIISRTSSFNKGILEDLVLVDFGGVKSLPVVTAFPLNKASGSPAYAPPEQLSGQPVLASDLYSLGMTCLHLFTGIHPFSLLENWRDYYLSDPVNNPENEQLAYFLDRLIPNDLHKRITSTEEAMTTMEKVTGNRNIFTPSKQPVKSSSWQCYATLVGHSGLFANVNTISLSPDNQILASGSDDKTIRLWDLQTQKEISLLRGHTNFVKSVDFHPQDKNRLVSGGWDRTVRLWDLQTASLVQTLTAHQDKVNIVCFSPDGNLIASGSSDKTIKLWDSQTQEMITSLKAHTLAVTALAFSPLQPILASISSDTKVKLWNLPELKLIHTLTEHIGPLRSVAFSPDGQWLATGGDDRTIRLWNMASLQCSCILSGHPWVVSALKFSPNSQILISGSWDKKVKLWQLSTEMVLDTLFDHTDSITCLTITDAQSVIITASNDHTIKLWKSC